MFYGKSEFDKQTEKITECREIVKRIVEYGVTSAQILNIIHFLAMNLEDHEQMIEIIGLIKSFEQQTLLTDLSSQKE